ncbi:MAG TPA: hypothetical protein VKP65_22260 [Rhodothermales bacterium]|nr:hypothetical protein [Rhodothermales bacterium]
MPSLLAVDLGLRTGLALYGGDGRLRWYRSQNFGSRSRLKRGVYGLLKELPDLAWLNIEGGGPLAEIWIREAERRTIQAQQIDAGRWRERLLHQREHRRSARAKQTADDLARRIIDWADAPRPTSLRHDAAEAILIGLWGVLEIGWLEEMPEVLRR